MGTVAIRALQLHVHFATDRTRLRYEVTVEDPVYLTGPGTLTQQWDHRPDLEFSQDTPGCDKDVASRYKASVPK